MFAWTELSVASLGRPAVMTPSKNEPIDPLLLSPPVPRTIDPSWCIGVYPGRDVGSAPEDRVARPPDCALPSLSAKKFCPLFLSTAVTNGAPLPVFEVFLLKPSLDWNRPFSRSACTHGPLP